MSTFWQGPARNDPGYKRARRYVLERDGGRCQIRGERCRGQATQAHHLDGVGWHNLTDVGRMVAACAPCNQAIGRPNVTDPAPMIRDPWWLTPEADA